LLGEKNVVPGHIARVCVDSAGEMKRFCSQSFASSVGGMAHWADGPLDLF
jgi:hypothetical protein